MPVSLVPKGGVKRPQGCNGAGGRHGSTSRRRGRKFAAAVPCLRPAVHGTQRDTTLQTAGRADYRCSHILGQAHNCCQGRLPACCQKHLDLLVPLRPWLCVLANSGASAAKMADHEGFAVEAEKLGAIETSESIVQVRSRHSDPPSAPATPRGPS